MISLLNHAAASLYKEAIMKKITILFIVLAIAVFCCSCSKAGGDDSKGSIGEMFKNTESLNDNKDDGEAEISSHDIPNGWDAYDENGIYLPYPIDTYDVVTGYGADFQIIDDTGSNINIIHFENEEIDLDDVDDDYAEVVLDSVTESINEIYSSSLETECTTDGTVGGHYIKKFGNAKCACISYSVCIFAAEYNVEYNIDFLQIIYPGDSETYAITFTFFADEDITADSAEEYFSEIISYLYVD